MHPENTETILELSIVLMFKNIAERFPPLVTRGTKVLRTLEEEGMITICYQEEREASNIQ